MQALKAPGEMLVPWWAEMYETGQGWTSSALEQGFNKDFEGIYTAFNKCKRLSNGLTKFFTMPIKGLSMAL